MAPIKAPGADGFPALFFQKCWSIISSKVVEFCLKVLIDGMDFNTINSTNIILIPKISHPTNLTNFRPISLCNVFYKLIAKMIINRFKEVMNLCIDEAQSAFVPGHLISDNIIVAYKILHTFRQKKVGKKVLWP